MVEIKKFGIGYYVERLSLGEPFTFARYGDGEWLAILGRYGILNADGCVIDKPLSDLLRGVVRAQRPYQHAMLTIAMREYGDEISAWLKDNNITMPWYGGNVFLYQSLKGNLFPLVSAIRKRRVLFVGNSRLRGLNEYGFFEYKDYIETPPIDAYKSRDRIMNDVFRSIDKNRVDFIGWSAGFAAKVFIDEVFTHHPEITQIDFGSMFDGYFDPLPHIVERGKTASRSFIEKGGFDWDDLRKRNTGTS